MSVDAALLSRAIEEFIVGSPNAAVLEQGEITFDFSSARYALSAEHGRCLLHLWSGERNAVRRVLDLQQKANLLRVTVQRFGQSKPTHLDIVRDRERRTPLAQKQARDHHLHLLERVLRRGFPDWTVAGFSNHADLERSFGPVYARGMMRRGRSAWACLGVNAQETQASVDGALTIGILWLDLLREKHAAELAIEGLRLFAPPDTTQVLRMRMAELNRAAAKFELFELEERAERFEQQDLADRGNFSTHLVRSTDEQRVRERFAGAISRMRKLVTEFETVAISGGELAFRMRGLEFARVRSAYSGNSLELADEIVFGVGGSANTLSEENAGILRAMLQRLTEARGAYNLPKSPLWRAQPERWLESKVFTDVQVIDERLDRAHVYAQVPAFSAADRAMIDVLCATRDGRLAVLELKADEDVHLPMQGLDYWSRVRHHQQRGEFQQYGYFAGRQLSAAPPLLYLVAPALHLHPSTDTLLRYLAPEIDVCVIGIDERWRQQVRVVFRKRRR